MAKIREDLIGVTIVRDDAGEDHILSAGAEVPKGLAVGEHLLSEEPKGKLSKKDAAASKPVEVVIPPKGGPGSGADAWRTYAVAEVEQRGLNIEIPDDASRDDIITALEEAKIPTE